MAFRKFLYVDSNGNYTEELTNIAFPLHTIIAGESIIVPDRSQYVIHDRPLTLEGNGEIILGENADLILVV